MGLIKDKHFTEEEISTWNQLVKREEKHRSDPHEKGKETEWIFRGQKDSMWGLQTTLEEAIGKIEIDTKELRAKYKCAEEFREEYDKKLKKLLEEGLNGQSIHDIESGLIRKFQRQYHTMT